MNTYYKMVHALLILLSIGCFVFSGWMLVIHSWLLAGIDFYCGCVAQVSAEKMRRRHA